MRRLVEKENPLIQDRVLGLATCALKHEFRELLPAQFCRSIEHSLGFRRCTDLNHIVFAPRRLVHVVCCRFSKISYCIRRTYIVNTDLSKTQRSREIEASRKCFRLEPRYIPLAQRGARENPDKPGSRG